MCESNGREALCYNLRLLVDSLEYYIKAGGKRESVICSTIDDIKYFADKVRECTDG